jgi:hypothetical protein
MESPSFGGELAVAVGPPEGGSVATPSPAGYARGRFASLRRRLASMKIDRRPAGIADDEAETELELMLLREQNMRLLSDRHRPFDLGMLLEQLRLRLSATDNTTSSDEAWAMLSEFLLLGENLQQASDELEAAIRLMRARLGVGRSEQELEQMSATPAPVADAP